MTEQPKEELESAEAEEHELRWPPHVGQALAAVIINVLEKLEKEKAAKESEPDQLND